MATAKRLYLYGISGLSLGLVLYAAAIFLGLLFDQVGLGTSVPGLGLGSDQSNRESLALAVGLVAVGLPVWFFHWAMVERMVNGGPSASAERRSIVRSVYFGIVMFWLAVGAVSSGSDVLREEIAKPLDAADPFAYMALGTSMAWLVIALIALVYHGSIRGRDLRLGPTITGAAAWWSRFCFYAFAAGAFLVALAGLSTIVTTLGQAASGYTGFDTTQYFSYGVIPLGGTSATAWWVRPVIAACATVIVYETAWMACWLYAHRLMNRDDEQGRAERTSKVRLTYFAVIVLATAGYAISGFGQGLATALEYIVGSWQATLGQSVWGEVLVSLAAAVPAVGAWLWHRRVACHESIAVSGSALRAIRPLDYLASLVGITAFATGLVVFLDYFLQSGSQNSVFGAGVDLRGQAASAAALAVVAAPVWLLPWLAGDRRREIDRIGEAGSTARRAFLFSVGGLLVAASAVSAALTVSRLARVAVGLDSSGLVSDIRVPVCVLIVALPLLVFHADWLRHDILASREKSAVAVGPEVAPAAAGVPTAAPALAVALLLAAQQASVQQEMVIMGPSGADFEAIRSWLAGSLPAGFTVGVRPGRGTDPA